MDQMSNPKDPWMRIRVSDFCILPDKVVALLKKMTLQRWKAWSLCTVSIFVLVFYFSSPDFISSSAFRDIGWKTANQSQAEAPWWEADDCQCETQACDKPSVTYKGMFEDEVGGTCGRRAWAAGNGQRVLSFSLFGNNSEYWEGLDLILPKVQQLYPGWKVRLYTNPRGRAAALCPLLHRYSSLLFVCDIVNLPPPLGNLSNVHPMIWRVAPLGDPQVAIMVIRDTDSQVSEREVAAVQEWLKSGKRFHVMRDHPFHTMPVLGGMWGARWDTNSTATNLKISHLRKRIISEATGKNKHGQDQIVLKTVLWPAMAGKVMAHDSYNCRLFKGSSPWPTRRSNKKFVGAVRFRKRYENSSIPKPCPKSCRPPAHRDWLYC